METFRGSECVFSTADFDGQTGRDPEEWFVEYVLAQEARLSPLVCPGQGQWRHSLDLLEGKVSRL